MVQHGTKNDTPEAVDALVAKLTDDQREAVEALRAILTGADASILEGVKWNSSSFRTSEYFATVNLRVKGSFLGLVLHRGAKPKDGAVELKDPKGLLEWLGDDRALIRFESADEIRAQAKPLRAIVRQWLKFVD